MKSVLKVKSKNTQVTQEKVEPKYVEDKATEQYLDYINESGNVMRHNGDRYVNTGISLKGPRGAVGPRGLPGKDGITPHIGENGNWYIGEQDTGNKAALNTDEYVTKEELNETIGEAIIEDIQLNVANIDSRLQQVEGLAELSVEGGQIGIASATDFTNRTTEGDLKIPTVGAILNGADKEPTGRSRNIVSSNGVFGIIEDISNSVESYLIENYALLPDGTFDTSPSYKHAAIPVVSGEKYIVRNIGAATSNQSYTRYAFVTSKDSMAGGDIPFVAGTGIVIVPHKGAVVATIPEGCKYLLVNISINTSGSYPFSVSKVMTGDKLKSDIEQSSMCFSLNGDDNNLVSIDLHKFNFGATYRLYIGNTDIDMSTVTYTSPVYLRLFAAIYNENKERVGDLLAEVYIGTSLNNYYDFTIPSSLIEANNIINPQTCTLTVGMRASRGAVQNFRITDFSLAEQIYPLAERIEHNYANLMWVLQPFFLSTGMNIVNNSTQKSTSEHPTYSLYWHPCKKGELFRIDVHKGITSTSVKGFYVYHFASCPSVPDVEGENIYSKVLDYNESDIAYVVSPDDGYIGVYLYYGIEIAFFKIADYYNDIIPLFLNNIPITLSSGKYIDCDINSETFGEPKSINATVGITDYIDISKYAYICIFLSEVAVGAMRAAVTGSVFYNEDKQPISTICNITYAPVSKSEKGGCFIIPDGAKYVRLTFNQYVNFISVLESALRTVDSTPTPLSGNLITSGGVYDTIGIYKKSYKDIDPTEYRYTILANDKWGTSTGYSHFRIPVIEGERFVIINKGIESTYSIRYCLAKSLERGGNNEIDLVAGTHVESLESYKSVVIDIPETCNYLILHNNSNIDCYKFANISDVINEGNDEYDSVHTERLQYVDNEIQGNNIVAPPVLDSNGWEIPQTKQMNILIKKVRQLANIRWTPKLATIPITGTGVTPSYYAISEKIGIPYSGNGARTVGMGVSLETFMTAINNKYSLMYTEDLLEETSVWGSGVPHFPTNNHSRSYYGTYCNGFVAYVHGCDVPVYCGRFGFVSAMYHTFSPVFNPFDKDSFRQGDILTTGPNSSSTHSRLVYNVQRNSDGEVVSIQIAESSDSNGSGDSKGLVRIHEPISGSTLDNYLQSMKNVGYEHYRNIQLYKNVDYDVSPFILLDNEESDDYVYNNDVCTFAGNKATFLVGQTVVINYNLSDDANWNYSHLRLYKDDTLIHTQAIEQIDSSDYPTSPIMQAGHAWKIDTALLNSAGIYKVCAYDGTNESSFTYFEVVTDNCTIEKIKDDVYDISFNGNEDVRGLILAGGSGKNYTWILLSEDEKELKKVRIYPKRTFNKFNMKFSQFNVAWYIQGHYGLIRSSVISIE